MKRTYSIFVITFLFLLISSLNSCTSIEVDSYSKKYRINYSTDQTDIRIVGHFNETIRCWFLFNGAMPMTKPKLDELFAEQILKFKGDGVTNLRIKSQYKVLDYVIKALFDLTGIYIGAAAADPYSRSWENSLKGFIIADLLISTRTLEIQGDVIKYEKKTE